MTGEEAYWAGLGPEEMEPFVEVDEEDDLGLCSGCHDYPCSCDDDDF